MTIAARTQLIPRYGSPAEVAAFLGVSTKTVRRAVESGALPSFRVGRRVLVAFRDADQFVRRIPAMATIHRGTESGAGARAPYVPPIGDEELARRNRAAIALLDEWEADGDEEEQRETMKVLREALGPDRAASSRNLFP